MRRFSLLPVLLLGTLTAFLTGCSRSPVATLTSSMEGPATPSGVQTNDDPSDYTGGQGATVTGSFTSGDEGQLKLGRFTLDLHKNTLQMPATITMRVASEDAMEVEIEVSPAEANDFQVPAQVIADMSDQPDVRPLGMFYWEDAHWEQTQSVSHPNQQTVVAHMKHLSACRVADEQNTDETARQR